MVCATGERCSVAFEDRVRLATSLGLTAYEARAYLALLERGEAKAGAIATAARVPRGRIYEVLDSLQEKGLLSVVPVKPLRYRPVDLEAFADRRRGELRRAERDIAETTSRLMSELAPRPAPGPTGDFSLVRKRRAMYRTYREMVEGARTSVMVSASEMCLLRGQAIMSDAYRDAAKRGVRVRILARVTPENRAAAEAYRAFAEVRHSDRGNRGTTVMVVDAREILIGHWNPDDEDPLVGDDVGLWSTNPGLVRSFVDLLEGAWKSGKALKPGFLGTEAAPSAGEPAIAGGSS